MLKRVPSPGVEPGLPKPQSGVLPLYYKGLQLYYEEIQRISFRRQYKMYKIENKHV